MREPQHTQRLRSSLYASRTPVWLQELSVALLLLILLLCSSFVGTSSHCFFFELCWLGVEHMVQMLKKAGRVFWIGFAGATRAANTDNYTTMITSGAYTVPRY